MFSSTIWDFLIQLCMGVQWGADGTTRNMQAKVDILPDGANWAGFGTGVNEMPVMAQAVLPSLTSHARVAPCTQIRVAGVR